MPDQQKRELNSAFLWSPRGKCWVSRAKEPNLWRAKEVAKKLGFTEEQREGERLTYAEQLERQAESAEERADRYEQYAANAATRGAQLQKPIENMRGDIAFFTQPIIAGHSGSQAFANRREKMFSQYNKGFEEYRKSAYFIDKAQTARETAEASKFNDKAYLDRRIKECKKEIRNREKNIVNYENILIALEKGEEKKRYNGEPYTVDEITSWIEREMELIEKAIDKQAYLENCLEELGGVQFDKSNIKVGNVVRLDRGREAEVMSTGPLNFNYRILTGGAAGMMLKAAYAEIKEVISDKEKVDTHPFKVGEQFTETRYTYEKDSFKSTKSEVIYEIIKASDTTIQLQAIGLDEEPITRKPRIGFGGKWSFSTDNRNGNTFYKLPDEKSVKSKPDNAKIEAETVTEPENSVNEVDNSAIEIENGTIRHDNAVIEPDNNSKEVDNLALETSIPQQYSQDDNNENNTTTKQHSDFGEKIGGAKKDLWQKRGLVSDDISGMNEREADKYIKKDNIWKKPDYQALVESGIPADVVYFIKTVRDSVETAPIYRRFDDTPEKRTARQEQYIDTVREIQGVVESIKTKADVFEAFNRCMVNSGYYEDVRPGFTSYFSTTEKGRNNPMLTNKLIKALFIKSEYDYRSKILNKAEKQQFGVPKENKIPKGFNVLFNDGKNSWSADNDWKPNTFYVVKDNYIQQKNFETKEEALKWVQEFAEQRSNGGKKRFVPPQLESVRRDGPDYRRGADIDGNGYIDTFNFKGGEFGNWMSQLDRQASLNYGYDALKDLAAALKISDKDIAYQGALSIAFGARGSGNAVAHYEPLRNVINLTKMKGAGSLAHEWWHGLDDYLGTKMGIKGYLSDNPHKHPLMKKLIDTIKYKPATPEQAAAAEEQGNARLRRNAESWLKAEVLPYIKKSDDEKKLAEYDTLKNAFLRGERGVVEKFNDLKKSVTNRVIPKDIREKLEIFERLLYSTNERTEPVIGTVDTDYYRSSKEMSKVCEKDGDYWESNVELTARAFATYVLDTLPYRSDYLLGHAECAVAPDVDKDGNLKIIRAFPEGEERKAINAVFDEIIAELKLQQYLTHDEQIPPEQPKTQKIETQSPEIATVEQKSIKETSEIEPPIQPLNKIDSGFFNAIEGQLSFFDIEPPNNGKKPSLLGGLEIAKAAVVKNDINADKKITERGKKQGTEIT